MLDSEILGQVLNGLLIGLPLMLTLGPISIMLINQGMNSGSRSGLPAALGVATADLTYSTLAAVAGSMLVAVLAPVSTVLQVLGAAVVAGLAVKIAIGARNQMRAARSGAAVGDMFRSRGGLGDLRGPKLIGTYYGLTIINPMTIILLSAVVVAGGRGFGTPGWVIGMTLASLLAHSGFVLFGSFLRRAFDPIGLARVGMFSALLMIATSVHLLMS